MFSVIIEKNKSFPPVAFIMQMMSFYLTSCHVNRTLLFWNTGLVYGRCISTKHFQWSSSIAEALLSGIKILQVGYRTWKHLMLLSVRISSQDYPGTNSENPRQPYHIWDSFINFVKFLSVWCPKAAQPSADYQEFLLENRRKKVCAVEAEKQMDVSAHRALNGH